MKGDDDSYLENLTTQAFDFYRLPGGMWTRLDSNKGVPPIKEGRFLK